MAQYFGLLRQLVRSRQFICCSLLYTLLLSVPVPESYLSITSYKIHLKLKYLLHDYCYYTKVKFLPVVYS